MMFGVIAVYGLQPASRQPVNAILVMLSVKRCLFASAFAHTFLQLSYPGANSRITAVRKRLMRCWSAMGGASDHKKAPIWSGLFFSD